MIVLEKKCFMFYTINANKNVELLFFKYENIQTESTCTEIAVEFRILYNNDNSKLQFHVFNIYFSLRKMTL